ncbi:hypothetical protein NMY22_g4009 [Coprinellus aureogranulatus]|nr:hypothetical protein NMY22_g4009 [Coprinellus aureogranulatus]
MAPSIRIVNSPSVRDSPNQPSETTTNVITILTSSPPPHIDLTDPQPPEAIDLTGSANIAPPESVSTSTRLPNTD